MAKSKSGPNRCWPGYEPVKGKPQHSQGSCRKKAASKSTAAEKRNQRARKTQIDAWRKTHNGSPRIAAQHLHAGRSVKTQKAK